MCFLVHMLAPQNLTALRINARNTRLAWEWSVPQYRKLRVLCQIILDSRGHTDVVSSNGLFITMLQCQSVNWTSPLVSLFCFLEELLWIGSESCTFEQLDAESEI